MPEQIPKIEVGDIVEWDTGAITRCEQQAWADNWNHHAMAKHAVAIYRPNPCIWRRSEAK